MKTKIKYLFTRGTIMLLFLVSTGNKVKAQKMSNYIGGGLETYSSGNTHGGCFTPYLNITHGRTSFSGGPVIQNQTMEIAGGKLKFSYNLSGTKCSSDNNSLQEYYDDNSLLQLNAFCFTQYISNAKLSHSSSAIEKMVARGDTHDWSNVRLSTTEAGIGFELCVKFSKRISWKVYAGGSVFYHDAYISGMYQEKSGPSLLLGTAIHICPL